MSRLTMRLSGRVYTNLNEFEKGQKKKLDLLIFSVFTFNFNNGIKLLNN